MTPEETRWLISRHEMLTHSLVVLACMFGAGLVILLAYLTR